MPGRLFVATLGFHENFILRLLNSRAARAGDGLLLVTTRPAAGANITAYNNTMAYATRLGVKVYPLMELDPENPSEELHRLTDTIRRLAREHDYSEIIIDITGGPKLTALLAILAALILRSETKLEVTVQSDTGGTWEARISGNILGAIACGIGEKAKILEHILDKPGATIHAISQATGLSPKTVANYISILKRQGLVYQKGRGAGLYLTEWGKLIALIAKQHPRRKA